MDGAHELAHRSERTSREAQRRSGQARVGIETVQPYEDRWDLLGTSTDEVPVMLPKWYRELAVDPRVGLPEGHPWKEKLPEW
jgi:hypothetical protein